MTTTSAIVLDTARRGELHHAIILYGPSPATLRELAVQIAKSLNCLNRTSGDDCASCTRIDRRLHPDVHFIELGESKKMISIEQIREIVAEATLRPYEGRNKVFIIDPADALSPSGSNSLLKTLEEPARDTTFILLTRTPDLLLQTVRSRSQAIFVGGEERRDDELAEFLSEGLQRFATKREGTALLAIAAAVSQQENVKDAMALLASIVCEAAAGDGELRDAVGRERLLAAADGLMAGIRALGVNADARLVVEQALAALV